MQNFFIINIIFSFIYSRCSTTSNETSCLNSSYFHCNKSLKCISYNRVGDGFRDCYYNEDELFSACQLNDSNRFECTPNSSKCFLPVAIGNERADCPYGEDEQFENIHGFMRQVPLSSVCNNIHEVWPDITGTNETDETNCTWWPCNNPYTQCTRQWNCLNGIDELNCPNTDCSSDEFQCKNLDLNLTYCLPLIHMFHKRKDNCTMYEQIQELYFYNGTSDINEYYYSF